MAKHLKGVAVAILVKKHFPLAVNEDFGGCFGIDGEAGKHDYDTYDEAAEAWAELHRDEFLTAAGATASELADA